MKSAAVFAPFLPFLLVASLATPRSAPGQAPPAKIAWQQSFGGSDDELLFTATSTADGGYLLGGSSASGPGGNKSAPGYGGNDFWVVRFDAADNKLWDRSFGGTDNDILFSAKETAEGGFVLGGSSSSSPGGNKSAPNYGLADMWIVRLDANGNKLWDRSFGGTNEDGLFAIQQTAEAGFLCAGYSYSGPGGNKTSSNYGGSDFWLLRLDANGNKLWEKSYGGEDDDICYNLLQVTNVEILGDHLADDGPQISVLIDLALGADGEANSCAILTV